MKGSARNIIQGSLDSTTDEVIESCKKLVPLVARVDVYMRFDVAGQVEIVGVYEYDKDGQTRFSANVAGKVPIEVPVDAQIGGGIDKSFAGDGSSRVNIKLTISAVVEPSWKPEVIE